MNIEVKVDTSKFDKMMSDFPTALARAQKRALMDIGQAVASRATMAFRNEPMRPSPWAPRKKSKRDDGHPLLIKSGSLRQSIGWKLQGNDTVVVGMDKKCAGYRCHKGESSTLLQRRGGLRTRISANQRNPRETDRDSLVKIRVIREDSRSEADQRKSNPRHLCRAPAPFGRDAAVRHGSELGERWRLCRAVSAERSNR